MVGVKPFLPQSIGGPGSGHSTLKTWAFSMLPNERQLSPLSTYLKRSLAAGGLSIIRM